MPDEFGPQDRVRGPGPRALAQHDHDAGQLHPPDEVHQAAQRWDVGAVHVVDADHHRALGRQPAQDLPKTAGDRRHVRFPDHRARMVKDRTESLVVLQQGGQARGVAVGQREVTEELAHHAKRHRLLGGRGRGTEQYRPGLTRPDGEVMEQSRLAGHDRAADQGRLPPARLAIRGQSLEHGDFVLALYQSHELHPSGSFICLAGGLSRGASTRTRSARKTFCAERLGVTYRGQVSARDGGR